MAIKRMQEESKSHENQETSRLEEAKIAQMNQLTQQVEDLKAENEDLKKKKGN